MTLLPVGRFHFQYVGELGAGGLGRVRKIRITESNAQRKPVGSEWACKELNEKWEQHPTMRVRFEREIEALKRMSHPNVVSYEGENLSGNDRFYLMPLYSHTIRSWIALGRKLGDWRLVAKHGAVLAEAMQHAHNLGFIHRDLKPDNILFNGGGPLVIADWGLGYFVHKESKVLQHLTRGGMGTEYYCCLEQWNTGKCDQRGDIYALGMTLDEMVIGVQRAIVVGTGTNGPTTDEASAGAQLFNNLLQRMTYWSPKGRPANMSIVAAELMAAAVAD